METAEVGKAEKEDREKAWEEVRERVGARPAAPRSLRAAPGSPGRDDPALASQEYTDMTQNCGWKEIQR